MSEMINLKDLMFLLEGLGITLTLCLCAMLIGTALGLLFGVMRTSRFRALRYLSWVYVYIIRGTPLLMQLFLVYYGLPLMLGYSISAFSTAVIGLSLYAGAYLAEIIKAGIQAVDRGQGEAAKALGMTHVQEFVHIVFPQALRVIIPPAAGFFIALIKDSSLVSAIGFMELTRSGKLIIARTFQPFTIYLIIAVIYFILCYTLSQYSKSLERRLSRNHAGT